MESWTDRFINNEMEPEERNIFCREMEKDKELREFVALRMLVVEGELIAAEQVARRAMKQQLQPSSHKALYLQIAVACICLLLIGGGIYGYSYKYDTSDIYDANFAIPVIERSRGEGGLKGEVADINDKIVTFYDEGKFYKITDVIRSVSPDIISQLPVHSSLYIAVSFLENQQPKEATSILSRLHNTEYREEVEWLQLCGYLQMGKRKDAADIARRIIDDKGYYSAKATQILNTINKRKWF